MAMSGNGMRDAIIAEIPDPMISGYTKDQALDAAGGRKSIQAIASAVVTEVKRGRASITFTLSGSACGNYTQPGTPPVLMGGDYTVTISADSLGDISGLSATNLKSNIRNNINNSGLTGINFGLGNADESIEALSEAIVEEIEGNGKVDLSSASQSGTVLPTGGTPTGTISETGTIVDLSASRLRQAMESKIDAHISEDVDFTKASARTNLMAIAEGIVKHIHGNADVNIRTDFSNITCPVNPGPSGTTVPPIEPDNIIEDSDATIS